MKRVLIVRKEKKTMKKLVCMVLAALMGLLGTALAEGNTDQAAIDAFSGSWICETDEDYTVDIWYQDGEFIVLNMRFAGDDAYTVEFERCFYDGAQNALVCEGGELLYENLADLEEREEDEGPVTEEVIASSFGAVLTVGEDGLLRWTGSGDAVADQAFLPWKDEDDGLFTGEWECGDAWISVELHNGVYDVFATKDKGEYEVLYWIYTCALDETGALTGSGANTDVVFDEEWEIASVTEVYADGSVTFTLDNGALLWHDAVENAGRDMRFTPVEEVEETEEETGEEQ